MRPPGPLAAPEIAYKPHGTRAFIIIIRCTLIIKRAGGAVLKFKGHRYCHVVMDRFLSPLPSKCPALQSIASSEESSIPGPSSSTSTENFTPVPSTSSEREGR